MRKNIAPFIFVGSVLSFVASISFAEMQIPNPLIRPVQQNNEIQKNKVGNLPTPISGESIGQPQMPYERIDGGDFGRQSSNVNASFTEVRGKLATFYVSAIVGNQAILRRASAQSIGENSMTGMPGPGMPRPGMPGYPITQPVAQGQTETIMITHGEPIDFIGDAITLTPKITSSRVYIYYTENGAGFNKGAVRRRVAFLGQVESTAASVPVAIVLKKADPLYKLRTSVETTSVGSNGVSNDGNSNSNQSINQMPQY